MRYLSLLLLLTLVGCNSSAVDEERAQYIANRFCHAYDSAVLKIKLNGLWDVRVHCNNGNNIGFDKGDIVLGEKM